MTHEQARAQLDALFEGRQADVQREPLREHLKGCPPCQTAYDRAAQAMRSMLGDPAQMTEEELWLFEPPLPAAKVVPLFRPGRAVALALAASLAGVVFYATVNRPEPFSARGGDPVAVTASARAVCLRGDAVVPTCAAKDTVLFAVSTRGLNHVQLFDGERLVGEGEVADAPDTTLPWTVEWRPDLQASVRLARCATCEPTVVKVGP
ncbi:MAG: zf-HC2 domain-containing protein [Archangiaceae bacterium]|nr:zf-HC2 domain-containing protein [Archangiaceae bacterium]